MSRLKIKTKSELNVKSLYLPFFWRTIIQSKTRLMGVSTLFGTLNLGGMERTTKLQERSLKWSSRSPRQLKQFVCIDGLIAVGTDTINCLSLYG